MDTEGWTLAVIMWEKLDRILDQGQLHRSAKTVRATKFHWNSCIYDAVHSGFHTTTPDGIAQIPLHF